MSTSVIVARIEAECVGQRKDLVKNGIIKAFRIALLKVCATTATNEKSVARKGNSLLVADIRYTTCLEQEG